jgi:hypothetical protein
VGTGAGGSVGGTAVALGGGDGQVQAARSRPAASARPKGNAVVFLMTNLLARDLLRRLVSPGRRETVVLRYPSSGVAQGGTLLWIKDCSVPLSPTGG